MRGVVLAIAILGGCDTPAERLTGRTCGAPSPPGEPGPDYLTRFTDVLYGVGVRSNGDSDLLMPPDQKLPDVEIDLIERWVAAGAPCD